MQFNQFSMYSFQAGNLQGACDDKILVDIQRLNVMKEYDEVKTYVDKVFGEFDEEQKQFEYPNEVIVVVQKGENSIGVGALKGEKQIFGKRWRLETPEEVKKRLENNK